ncbi:MAG: hypothetical protein ACLGHO_07870 [Gammaproteobacteria bacterium]
MEIRRPAAVCLASVFVLASCATSAFDTRAITDVYVADFHSDDMQQCRPADVDLSHSQAKEFFTHARRVDRRTLHDYYNYAPCYIEGTLKYKQNSCNWEIRAGATGHIACGNVTEYFACDTCDDLFKPKSVP